MCGITGFSRADGRSSISNASRLMKAALLAIENRGTDSTGFAWSNPDGKGFYWKKPMAAHEALLVCPLMNPDAVTGIGHTRWATQGSKHKNENNHPVIDDGIMLVHNGIITNDKEIYEWLDPGYPPKAEVDTAAFAAMLAHPEELFATDVTELLAMVGGSAAFAWIETSEPEALHLARTIERPLTIGWTRLGDLIMSSTPTTLAATSEMIGVRVRRVTEVEEGTYLKVIGGEIVEEKSFRPLRSYRYHNKTSSVGSTTKSTTDYVAGPNGTYQPVGGVVGERSRKSEEDKAFWERVRDDDEFWERVWNGEDINDLIDDLEDQDEDLSEAIARDEARERLQSHVAARPGLTVIQGEKGKTAQLELYDQDTLKGATTVDEEQKAYENYLADMDQIDWREMSPRRGWKQSAAADVAAALSREDR